MTRREMKLVEALIGESRIWDDGFGLGVVGAAGRGSRKQGGGAAKGAGGKKGGTSKKQSTTAKSTAKKGAGGGTNALAKRPGAMKGTGKTVGKAVEKASKAKG